MLSTAGLAVLDALCFKRDATAQALATETGYSRKQVYRVIDDFRDAGLVTESRAHHNQRVVRAIDHPVVETYRKLVSDLGHVEWPELLSPATMRVCWYLDEPRRVTTIADRLGVTRQSVHNALLPLKNRAMVDPDGPAYALAADLRPVLEFVRAVVEHEHRTRVRDHAHTATVEWCDPKRALVRVHDSDDTAALRAAENWDVTGLARFRDYGLQFFLAGEPLFWYAPDNQLTAADVICHTLVREADARRVSYAMLLIEHEEVGRDALTETARWYGIASLVSPLYEFIDEEETAGDGDSRLPGAREYTALKEQYGVV